jgi:two-component system cell cycle sensor histidine kinase PleC
LLKGVSGPLPANQRRNLTRIDSNATHLLAIINDILDISRIEAGKMPVNASLFRVADLLSEVLAEVAPLVDGARVHLSSECSRTLPPLRADRQKVKQILVNLLSNALKFTPTGSVIVSASFDAPAKEMRISVADSGIGIAEKDQVQIFDDFRQADASLTRAYGGAGLGLAICRRLAQLHNGRVELKSTLGKGSTFTLVLPARRRAS